MDDDTVSVSKGVFLFKNNFKHRVKPHKKYQEPLFATNLWYQAYSELWEVLEGKMEILNHRMFSKILTSLLKFVNFSHNTSVEEIPTAALLTGINMPDHDVQFTTLEKLIRQHVSRHVIRLSSQDCSTVKSIMENMINQFINPSDDDELLGYDHEQHLVKKSQINLSVLQCWYENLYGGPKSSKRQKAKDKNVLVVILPDFESFNPLVLQKFILIISCYIKILPFVFIYGIATSISTLHTFLPYQVSSKINLKIFSLEPSIVYLNKVLENVFFTLHCPFQLSGKIFSLFTDIFLFYDLSVNNFIRNIKFAMMEHFSYGQFMALCNLNKKVTKKIIMECLDHNDCESIRKLMSFRKLVENETYENRIKLLTDDDYFKTTLDKEIIKLQKYIRRLFLFLKCLLILVEDLPRAPLGKQLRELYSISVSKNITKSSEYKECFQLLQFQSKEELCSKIFKVVEFLANNLKENHTGQLNEYYAALNNQLDQIKNVDMSAMTEVVDDIDMENNTEISGTDRKQFKEKLLDMSKKTKPSNRYEQLKQALLGTLNNMFEEFLLEYKSFYFHEIFFFDNISIKNYIIGTHRSAIHNALNDPQYYLQCDCCAISNLSSIKPFMPDICIAYKLHLECGRLINLYDWLQAFLSIVDPTEVDDDSQKIVDPALQARFTQAVAELEYLGFIKSSKRKTDHVTRLTWGG